MWILRSQKTGAIYHLLVGQTYTVGRKDTDILIENDPSISRKHAVFTVSHQEGNLSDPSKFPTLKIQDTGSKYGTSRNGDQIKGEIALEAGDNVKFGQFESVFGICYVPLIITTSCIDSAVKKELKKTVHRLGGHFVSEWKTDCTHLVMSDIKITIKAVCCLISQKPLVSPQYVLDMEKKFSSGLPEPVPNKYIPPVGENSINKEKANFDIVPERKNIFRNQTFVFIDAGQLKKMRLAIVLGGGDAKFVDPNLPTKVLDVLKSGACFVQPQIHDAGVSICQQKVFDFLQKNNKRMIQESDFGMAVAYCSTEVYCNPDSDLGNSQVGIGRVCSQTLTQQEVPVCNATVNERKPDNSVPVESERSAVNQSCSLQEISSSSSITGRKRKIRDSSGSTDAIQQCSKQTKLEDFVKVSSSKPNNQEKAADSISIEGIALCASSVKEEPQSADEMDLDNNSVFVDSPAAVQHLVSSTAELNTSIESSLNHSASKLSKGAKKHKPEQSSRVSSSKQDGFLNSKHVVADHDVNIEDVGDEEKNLPRNLIQVEFADLVCVKPKRTDVRKNQNSSNNVKNFKKFNKVLPVCARLLPQIIGGHDLEAYSKQASKALDDILKDSCEAQSNHNHDDEAGEFDWESQPRQRKR